MVPNRERTMSMLYIVTILVKLICKVHEKAELEEAEAGIKIARSNINNLR